MTQFQIDAQKVPLTAPSPATSRRKANISPDMMVNRKRTRRF
ncbi:hypothetical protein IWX87_002631 [Polaromonas sp. CG_9.7]|nr:hypothetical protein [Polaromonas sp. CG_9.7]MBG6114867.1 hypothetical protein [Polaromonas sp. CG_9.2]MDH6184714.1 hypothetical protein [Polaromonas sp. CG_23.6]